LRRVSEILANLLFVFALAASGCDSVTDDPRFVLHDPYAFAGTWYRGNFHMHSSHSDGAYHGVELAGLYGAQGYDVLCISDHNQWGDQDGGSLSQFQTDTIVHDWNGDGTVYAENVPGSGVEAYVQDWRHSRPKWSIDAYEIRPVDEALPVLIPGAETSYTGWHIGLLGHPAGWIEAPGLSLAFVTRTHDAGGFVFLAHPALWNGRGKHLTGRLDMRQFDALEIMNGLHLTKGEPADATPLWDELLTMGYRLWGLANDDAHTPIGSPEAAPFTAFHMVLASERSVSGFLEALHRGSSYGSTGLTFSKLGSEGDVIVVTAPGAAHLTFIGRSATILLQVDGESASYLVHGNEGYVRVEAVGSESGPLGPTRAWSQPFFVERQTD
jgi:hypothetical protein